MKIGQKYNPQELKEYLDEDEIVDFLSPKVKALADSLSRGAKTDEDIARHCFMYVRDNINHSGDYRDDITTLKASEVLKHSTGWCYSKSILLAALLRANGIPAGFCYQRLSCNEYEDDKYCLHGLNAVYLKEHGWYRIDARGNKDGVDAQFTPPYEKLAFEVGENEVDLYDIHVSPIYEVVEALKYNKTYAEMVDNFPDIKKHT